MLSIRNLRRLHLGPLSLDVPRGTCTAINGPSGSGKTLILRAIADLDPNSAEITLDGTARETFTGPAWRRQVGYLPAEPGWWAETVREHFREWPEAAPWLHELGLAQECGDWRIDRLSTGERQRLAFIRLLLQSPAALLLDEPTAALDQENAEKLGSVLKDLKAQGRMIILISHDPGFARAIADNTAILRNGTLLRDSTPAENGAPRPVMDGGAAQP